MAETLSVQIALDGGKEIEQQLEDIGTAGKKAFSDISAAAAKVGGFDNLDPSETTKHLEDMGVTGEASINKIIDAVKKASILETFVNGVKAVENAFASLGTAIEKSITIMAKHAAASAGLGRAGVAAVTTMIASFGQFAIVAATAVVAIGAIILETVKATEEINRLSAAAIQAGISIADMAKAENIFKAIGLSATDSAAAVSSFNDAMTLKNVKDAIANIDEFGRVSKTNVDSFGVLERAAQGYGEAADLARQKLTDLGRVRVSVVAQDIDKIKESAQSLPDKILAIIGVLEKMQDPVERNRLIFQNFSKDVGTQLVQAFNAGGVSADALKQKLADQAATTQAQAQAATRLTLAWQNLKNVFTGSFTGASATELNAVATALQSILSLLNTISSIPGPKFSDTVRELQAIGALLTSIASFGANMWDSIVQGAATAWQTVIDWINKAIDAVKSFIGMGGGQAASAGGSGGIGSAAGGGMIGGRGTGTSDSNLAWVSRGEYITPARAVAQPGVLAFLEALRRTGGDLSGVMRGMGRFALGGLVTAPSFASGGMAGMSHVTIAFPGVQPIGGLRAPAAVVDELHRAAALAQVRSGGRKPSRYS